MQVTGSAVPRGPRGKQAAEEDVLGLAWQLFKRKFNFDFTEEDKLQVSHTPSEKVDTGALMEMSTSFQVQACHRGATTPKGGESIILMLNTTIRGSVFDRLLFRKDNWNGELGGDTQMQLNVEKFRNKYDMQILDVLLMMRWEASHS
jgi:hypothetical protein